MGDSALWERAVRVVADPLDPCGLKAYSGELVSPELRPNADEFVTCGAIVVSRGPRTKARCDILSMDRISVHCARIVPVSGYAPGDTPPVIVLELLRTIACDATRVGNGQLQWTPTAFGDAGGQWLYQYNNILNEAFEIRAKFEAQPAPGPVRLELAFNVDRVGGYTLVDFASNVSVKA